MLLQRVAHKAGLAGRPGVRQRGGRGRAPEGREAADAQVAAALTKLQRAEREAATAANLVAAAAASAGLGEWAAGALAGGQLDFDALTAEESEALAAALEQEEAAAAEAGHPFARALAAAAAAADNDEEAREYEDRWLLKEEDFKAPVDEDVLGPEVAEALEDVVAAAEASMVDTQANSELLERLMRVAEAQPEEMLTDEQLEIEVPAEEDDPDHPPAPELISGWRLNDRFMDRYRAVLRARMDAAAADDGIPPEAHLPELAALDTLLAMANGYRLPGEEVTATEALEFLMEEGEEAEEGPAGEEAAALRELLRSRLEGLMRTAEGREAPGEGEEEEEGAIREADAELAALQRETADALSRLTDDLDGSDARAAALADAEAAVADTAEVLNELYEEAAAEAEELERALEEGEAEEEPPILPIPELQGEDEEEDEEAEAAADEGEGEEEAEEGADGEEEEEGEWPDVVVVEDEDGAPVLLRDSQQTLGQPVSPLAAAALLGVMEGRSVAERGDAPVFVGYEEDEDDGEERPRPVALLPRRMLQDAGAEEAEGGEGLRAEAQEEAEEEEEEEELEEEEEEEELPPPPPPPRPRASGGRGAAGGGAAGPGTGA
ncbi:hypothetical protein GPECTOR_94g665 [Gonium pectorale]|uniref:Uncharacterized protein n=1 Tax=Gonium pectorale TaxID=33097 RepID=A0A150G0D1_GONPE|nr:hypothetical protein GPECTOR_94g665 [Gonium pectorale]|eukprot:KXZ43343.1 hypothetical protein GPECTOR_94g665 [Gonium pectorale]